MMNHYEDGKVVVITGGSSGFGLEAARLLLEMDAKVAVTGRDANRLEAARQDGYPSAEKFARTLEHCIDIPDSCFIQETRIWGTAQVPGMVNPF